MVKLKRIIFALYVLIIAMSITASAQETELNVSLDKTAVLMNTSTAKETDASVMLTSAGYKTANNATAVDEGMAIQWVERGYIDIDLECDAMITKIVWKKNHVFGAIGVLNVYVSNDADFSESISLGELTNGETAFNVGDYYRYVRLQKNTNYDFYPGQISVYGYKKPVEFTGIMNKTIDDDSVIKVGFSEMLSVDTKLENIKVMKNHTEIKINAALVGNNISITPQNGWQKGGIYKIIIPSGTVVAEDKRAIGAEIEQYFAVNTESIDVKEFSFANNVLTMKLHNKTEKDISLSVWSTDCATVPYSIAETTGVISAGRDYEAYISVSNKFSIYIFEDCSNMKLLFDSFTNTGLSQPKDGAENGVKYVDGVITVTGTSEKDEVTVALTSDNETVSATTAKSITTAAVENGKYTVSIEVDTEHDSENCKVWIADGNSEKPLEYYIYVYNKDDILRCTDRIAKMSAQELKNYFENEENAKIITAAGIIDERPKNDVYEQISALTLNGAYTDIVRAINTELVLAIVKEKGFIYGVEKYNEYLQVDKTEELCKYVYENGISKEAESFMSTDYNTVDKFKAELLKGFKKAIFTNAPSVEYAMDFARKNNDLFGFDFSGDYNELSTINKKNVIAEAMKGTSLESMKKYFKEAVEKYKKGIDYKTSGGSGGGGFSSATIVTIPQELPEIKIGDLSKEEQVGEMIVGFSDLDESHWAYKSVTELAKKGIINGYDGKFNPNANVTREEFVKMIVAAVGVEAEEKSTFEDVPDDTWYAVYVSAAKENGIISGISETHFGTGLNITRQDIAVMLYNALNDVTFEGDREEVVFADENQIADYAKEPVKSLSSINMIKGRDDNNFAPTENATRAEAAELIYRLINQIS